MMLPENLLRQVAFRSQARDIEKVEIDVILTILLQLFHERGLNEHLAFKGGTMLRKMIFGPKGRLSTDLDFTKRSEISRDELMLLIVEALNAPYRGLTFAFEKDKDWYVTDDGCAANPLCVHAANARGQKIKIQVSVRETPVMPVVDVSQLPQDYFRIIGFEPASIPCLAMPEIIAEKIRAASQRSKVRDLYDLAEIAKRPLPRDLIRGLAVLKLWDGGGKGLDYGALRERIERDEHDVADLSSLLRKGERPDVAALQRGVVDGFQFLADLTDVERALVGDSTKRLKDDAAALRNQLVQMPY